MDGAVGLLSACLATLLLSHLSVVFCGCSSARNKQTLTQNMPQTNPHTNDNDGHGFQKDTSRAKVTSVRSLGASDVTAEQSTAVRGGWRRRRQVSMPSTSVVRLVEVKGGAWERWDRWTSSERHACAAILVSLIFVPTVV